MSALSYENASLLPSPFAFLKDLNIGIILLAIYFLFDFGSFQGVFEIVKELRLPFIIGLLSAIYALYLVATKRVDWQSATTTRFFLLCLFIIVYAQISTEILADRKALLTLFIQYFANYLIFVSCAKKPSQFIFLIDIWLFGILHSSYHAIHQGGKLYDSIWLRDENHISLLVATAIPFAFILFRQYRSKPRKLFYLICLVSFIVVNIVAASRGGLLTMIIAVFLCLLLSKNKLRNLVTVATAILIVYLIFSYSDIGQRRSLSKRITTTLEQGTQEGTVDDRLYLWGYTFRMFYDHPIIGVGLMNFPVYFYSYEKGERYSEKEGSWRVAHSTPLQWLAETGIIGSIILLLLQAALYRNWKMRPLRSKNEVSILNNISHACIISQISFWIGALFLTLLPYPFYWCLIPFSEGWKNICFGYVDQQS
jgi:O-antigen ligase